MTENIEAARGTCFFIAPIGLDDSDIRKRSDQVLRHVVRPAAKNCGFTAVIRADEISQPGIITTQVIQPSLMTQWCSRPNWGKSKCFL